MLKLEDFEFERALNELETKHVVGGTDNNSSQEIIEESNSGEIIAMEEVDH